MFADDCLIFAKTSHTATRNILRVLNFFSKASGQQINYRKSSLYFSSNVHSTVQNDIACCLSIQHKSCIGKCLGVHDIIFCKDPINFSELILRIYIYMQKKLVGWKAS